MALRQNSLFVVPLSDLGIFPTNGKVNDITYWVDENGCWICTSHKCAANGKGPAYTKVKGKSIAVVKLLWEQDKGEPFPKGKVVRHDCDNPVCINPDHVRPGTQKENLQDMTDRGRRIKGSIHPNTKLADSDVAYIRSSDMSIQDLADKFGIAYQTVWGILRGRRRM